MKRDINTVRDLLNCEDLVNYITEDITEVPEDSEVTYEVWAIGYSEDEMIADTEMLLGSYNDPDEAVAKAKATTFADIIHKAAEETCEKASEVELSYISVEVETVIKDEEETMNIGTIYRNQLWINDDAAEEEQPTVFITEDDYELLEDGTLKISCTILKDYNKNDYVQFFFVGEDTTPILTYKIISKVLYADGNYYHCEFMY